MTSANQQKQMISRLAQRGDIDKAQQLCTTLCEQTPDDPEAWFILGAIYGAIPDYPEAERCCKNALALAPEHAMLRFNLAVALLKQEKCSEAIEQLEHALALHPTFADAYRELGNAQSMIGEPLSAILSYQKSIELDPGSATSFINLGNTYQNLDRLDDAAESFQQAIELQPERIDAHAGLATILIYQFKFDKVIEYLEQATRRFPDASVLLPLLATAHHQQGEADIALKYYKKALSIEPDSINAKAGLAGMLALQGKYTRAGELLTPLLENNPQNPVVKKAYVMFADHFGATQKAIEIAERELKDHGISARTKTQYYFPLAHLYEKQNKLDIAFEHYVKGNQSRDAQFNYASYLQTVNTTIDYFSKATMTRVLPSGNSSSNLVFIVGMPRSGTSLVEQILASHPDVFGAGERHDISRMVDGLQQTLNLSSPYPHCLDSLTPKVLGQLADYYLGKLNTYSTGTARYFTDKMPSNFMHLGFISLLFPNAKIIHCTRDPRDTCLSCFFKLFSGELPYTYSLTDLGRFYRLYQKTMSHWEKVLPAPIYELNYEKLISNQETETRKLVEFCGLDWDDACLDFHQTDRTVATASHSQVRQPLYASSVGRWRAYEKHLEPLFTALRTDTDT